MRSTRPRSTLPRGLSWLLWLVLLLPLAQTAALWHGYAHGSAAVVAGAGAGREDDSQSTHAAHCGLCLAAAHLGAGALPAAPLALRLPAALQGWLAAAAGTVWHAGPTLAYRSRAPPFVSR